MDFEYTLACVPTTIQIMSVSAHLQTTTRLTSLKTPSVKGKERMTTRRTLLFTIDGLRSGTEDTVVEIMDEQGNPVEAPDSGVPSSSRPYRTVPHGGRMHVSITSLYDTPRLPLLIGSTQSSYRIWLASH